MSDECQAWGVAIVRFSPFLCRKKAKMKRYYMFIAALACIMSASAQESKDSVQLGEVTIQSERVKHTVEGQKFYPTAAVKAASHNAYSLLSKMTLPKVQVNEVMRTISMPEALGKLQLRINGIIASRQDLAALDPKRVRYVEYIDKPGARYGNDVALVINLVMEKPRSGYALGTDLMQTLTSELTRGNLMGRYNKGRSEWAAGYEGYFHNLTGLHNTEQATYQLANDDRQSILRQDMGRHQEDMVHNAEVKYSLQDSDRLILQAKLEYAFDRTLKNKAMQRVVTESDQYEALNSHHSRTQSPTLDLYLLTRWGKGQSLTANTVGSLTDSRYDYHYMARQPYQYDAKGHTAALMAEGIYENKLKPFALSFGLNWHQKYTNNKYFSSLNTRNCIHNSTLHAFAQLAGSLTPMDYRLSLGAERVYYHQADATFDRILPKPRLTLNLPMGSKVNLNYHMEYGPQQPRLEYLGDFRSKENEWEVRAGNPSLHPDYAWHNTLSLSVRGKRQFTQLTTHYRHIHKACMQDIRHETHPDGSEEFVFTKSNQRSIQMFYTDCYTQIFAIPDKLTLTANGGFYRMWNFGNTYTHVYNTLNGSLSVTAYLGKLTLSSYLDSGWKFLEGESKGHNGGAFFLTGSYRLNERLNVGIYWQHCFKQEVTPLQVWVLNQWVQKKYTQRNRDFGNMVSLSLSYRLSKGHKYKNIEKTLENKDTDTGIIKKTEK